MKQSNFYTSSIGRKVIMASTGLFLMVFLIVHLGFNATILVADDGILFDRTTDLLRNHWELHCLELWLPSTSGTTAQSHGLYRLMQVTMSQWWVVATYVLGCVAIAAHLLHGWRSAAITFGLTDRSLQLLAAIGTSFAILIPLGLAAIPIALFTSFYARF